MSSICNKFLLFGCVCFKSSVIKQKGVPQNGSNKKTKHAKLGKKWCVSGMCIGCLSGGKKCSFFGKFGMLCFLATSILRFTLLPYYRQNEAKIKLLTEMNMSFKTFKGLMQSYIKTLQR